jgi:hypothetical protein
MGACSFSEVQFGKSAQDAYDKAVKQALYEYGHDPYNGTISTTNGIQQVALPASLTPDEFELLIWENRDGAIAPMPVRRKFKAEWERKWYLQKRKAVVKFYKLPAAEQQRILNIYPEKWGAALCYVLPPKEQRKYREMYSGYKGKHGKFYQFFGLAAE